MAALVRQTSPLSDVWRRLGGIIGAGSNAPFS